MTVTEIISIDKKRSRVFFEQEESIVLYNGEIRRFHMEAGRELKEELFFQIQEEILKNVSKKEPYIF